MEPSDLPYPDGANVGLMFTGISGLEAAALLTSKGRLKNINYLFVSPLGGLFFGKNKPDQLFARSAFYFDSKGKPVLARFKTPIPIHALDYSSTEVGELRQKIESNGLPLLNSFSADHLADDKIVFGKFLLAHGIPTPQFDVLEGELSQRDRVRAIANLSSVSLLGETLGGIVVKPHNASTGDEVKMFDLKEMEKAAKHAQGLVQKGYKVLVQERIFNSFWKDEKIGSIIDWNLRVLTTWDREEVVINPEMIEVRYQPFSHKPVNKSKGSKVMTLNQFFTYHGISLEERDEFMEGIRKTLEPAARAYEEKVRATNPRLPRDYKNTGLIGWDLIREEAGTWYVIEANAGRVGGLQTIDSLVLSDFKGRVLIPVIKHFSRMAQAYKKLHPNAQTEEEGSPLDFWEDGDILNDLSVYISYLGELKIAERLERLAILRKPKSAAFHNNLGHCLHTQKRLREAAKEFRQAIKIDSNYRMAQFNLARCLSDIGDWKGLEKISKRYLGLYPSDVEMVGVLGVSLLNQEKFEEAKGAFLLILEKTDPVYKLRATIYCHLGILYSKLEDFVSAEEAFRNSIHCDRKKWDSWIHLGVALVKQNRYREAIEAFESAARIDFENQIKRIEPYRHMGHSYIQLKEWKKAEETFRDALELNGKGVELLNDLAVVLVLRGYWKEAMNPLTEAIRMDAPNPALHENLGLVSMKLGEWATAFLMYERLLKMDPKNSFFKRQRMKAKIRLGKLTPGPDRKFLSSLSRETVLSLRKFKENEGLRVTYMSVETKEGTELFPILELDPVFPRDKKGNVLLDRGRIDETDARFANLGKWVQVPEDSDPTNRETVPTKMGTDLSDLDLTSEEWRALTPDSQDKIIAATKSRFNALKETNFVSVFIFGLTHWRMLLRKEHVKPNGMALQKEIALVARGLGEDIPIGVVRGSNIRMVANEYGKDSVVEEFINLMDSLSERKVQLVVITDPHKKDEEQIKRELELKGIPRAVVKVIYQTMRADGTFSFRQTLLENPWLTEDDYSLWVVRNHFWSELLGKILGTRLLSNGSEVIALDLQSLLVALTSQ
ncbi:MAG: tetratricopeptide repeat protein [Elusimicrobia bacterium]|nr:tetratricopeptide repeat protein [Elusimicrobiota bacterium]